MSRLRNVLITVNNPPDNEYKFPDYVSYCVFQLERGESGTLHHQMYCEFENQVRLSTIKQWLPRAHVESRKGSQSQAIDYCTKEDTRVDGPWEYGTPKQQGARRDLEEIVTALHEGSTVKDIAISNPSTFIRYHRGIERWSEIVVPPPRRDDIKLIVYHGPPGTGKSRRAFEDYPDAYKYVDNYSGWFNGYNGEDVVIMDEFSCETPLRLLLQLWDRYPHRMPVKGGFVPIRATTFVVTTNYPPVDWYNGDPAVQRRLKDFGQVVYMGGGVSITPSTSESCVSQG